ncbi:MAG: PHP domain-containing protein, partial [Bacilli bacterium]|nr:PHP domain-containing protein [Bacilli bacterium]
MFIPLYNKTNYTLLSSLLKIDMLISYAKNNNLEGIAIADSNMYGTMEFIKKCEKDNIKPVIGLELLLEDFKFVLYAKDYDGYKTLLKLSTIQNEKRITIDNLKEYHNQVIAVLPYQAMSKYEELKNIYEDIYLGYTNKQEEREVQLLTNNIVFFQE